MATNELVADQVPVEEVELQRRREPRPRHLEAEASIPDRAVGVADLGGASRLPAEAELAEGIAGAERVHLGQMTRRKHRHLQLPHLDKYSTVRRASGN